MYSRPRINASANKNPALLDTQEQKLGCHFYDECGCMYRNLNNIMKTVETFFSEYNKDRIYILTVVSGHN